MLRAFLAEIVADPILAHAILVEAPSAGSAFLGRYEAALRAFAALLREGRALCQSAEELPQTLEETIAGSLLWAVYQRLIAGEVDQIEGLLPSLAEPSSVLTSVTSRPGASPSGPGRRSPTPDPIRG